MGKLEIRRLTWLTSPWIPTLGLVLFGLTVAGLSFTSGFLVCVVLFAVGFPIYLLMNKASFLSTNVVARVTVALGSGSMLLALLFGFTPVAREPWIFWCLILVVIVISLYAQMRATLSVVQEKMEIGRLALTLFAAVIAIGVMAYSLRNTFNVSQNNQGWLPDDFPLFAEWGRLLGSAGGPESVIQGFSFKYHWLTYSLLGGIDRVIGENFLSGPVIIGPIIALVGLILGAVAIVRVFTQSVAASALAIFSVVFTTTVGTLPNSTGGLAVALVSPSHLISSFWLVSVTFVIVEICQQIRPFSIPNLMFALAGFVLMLSKATAFVTALVIMVVVAFSALPHAPSRFHPRSLLEVGSRILPFSLGGALAYWIYLRGITAEIGLEPGLLVGPDSTLVTYLVQLMPVGAYTFSLLALTLPCIALWVGLRPRQPLVSAGAILAILGISIAVILQMQDSNEAWFFSGSLALILPLGAVFAHRVIGQAASSKWLVRIVWLVALLGASALGWILSENRDSEFALLRPWFVPTIALAASLLIATAAIMIIKVTGHLPSSTWFRAGQITQLAIVVLFMSSISFGLLLRLLSFNVSTTEIDVAADNRNQWIRNAFALAISEPALSDNSPLAIYSRSSGEETIYRWIPFFSQKHPYFLREDDPVHLTFFSTEQGLMQNREELVRSFVEDNSLKACEVLKEDGVTGVWLTPNTVFDMPNASSEVSHSWITLDC